MKENTKIEPTSIGQILIADQERDVIEQRRMVQWLMDKFRREPDKITAQWLDLEHEDLLMQEAFLAELRERWGNGQG